tara:strand:- start:429 stop:707 length:279 start_codon:yes stop_codon:yes gene_type:complete
MFAYGPALLGLGEPMEVAVAFATASLGIAALSVACVGWIFRPISWPMRALFLVSALLMINTAGISDLAGIGMLIALVGWTYFAQRRHLQQTT